MVIFCPECKRPIEDDDALLCLYCGAPLRRPAGFLGRIKYPAKKIILVMAIALLIAGFLFLMVLR